MPSSFQAMPQGNACSLCLSALCLTILGAAGGHRSTKVSIIIMIHTPTHSYEQTYDNLFLLDFFLSEVTYFVS